MECTKLKTCEKCMCVDTIENPIFEYLDEDGFVEERICMDCFVEEIEE